MELNLGSSYTLCTLQIMCTQSIRVQGGMGVENGAHRVLHTQLSAEPGQKSTSQLLIIQFIFNIYVHPRLP